MLTPQPTSNVSEAQCVVSIPKIAIRFCTQCKWNLRAAYYAQELLQTFSTTLGEISLIPTTGGIFDITIYHAATHESASASASNASDVTQPNSGYLKGSSGQAIQVQTTLVWERKRDGGFPEVKELKNRVRNIIDPQKDMGHIDRSLKKNANEQQEKQTSIPEIAQALTQPQAAGGESLPFGSNFESQETQINPTDTLSNSGKANSVPIGGQECEDCN